MLEDNKMIKGKKIPKSKVADKHLSQMLELIACESDNYLWFDSSTHYDIALELLEDK